MRTRFAEEKDLPAMAEIERRCFHTPWSEESLRDDLTGNPLSVYMVLEAESGDVAGYMSLWRILDEGHINNVAVLPEYRRRGGASEMLEFMLEYSDITRTMEKTPLLCGGTMKDNRFLTLAIESSCDETAAAVLSGGRDVLSDVVSSQIEIHEKYGGVVPEIASRHHLTAVNSVIDEALDKAGVSLDDIDLVGVTCGPGLVGSLVIGIAAAKAIAMAKEAIADKVNGNVVKEIYVPGKIVNLVVKP